MGVQGLTCFVILQASCSKERHNALFTEGALLSPCTPFLYLIYLCHGIRAAINKWASPRPMHTFYSHHMHICSDMVLKCTALQNRWHQGALKCSSIACVRVFISDFHRGTALPARTSATYGCGQFLCSMYTGVTAGEAPNIRIQTGRVLRL